MNKTKIFPQIIELISRLLEMYTRRQRVTSTTELVKLASHSDMIVGTHYQTFKDLYDIAEFTLNHYIYFEHLPGTIEGNCDFLKELQSLLPTETERSVDQSLYQQFSTPIVASYLISLLARPNPRDVFFEPSAGTGSLSVFIAKAHIKKLLVNEIHQHRFNLLSASEIYHNYYQEDATQIHNIPKFLNQGINKIVMNPPFSRHINTKSSVDILAGANHLIAAYKTLSPKGTITLLINENFKSGSKAFKHFVKNAPEATCSLNAILDSSTFVSKGTKFQTRIMILHNYDTAKTLFKPSQLDATTVQEYLAHMS